MSWGSKNQIATSLSVTTTELYSSAVSLTPGESCHVQVIADSGGTTDSLIVNVYGTLDDSSETWDEFPLTSFFIDLTTGNATEVSTVIRGVYKFRLGFERVGSTDTISVNAYERCDGISA